MPTLRNAVLIGLGRQGKSHFLALKGLLEMGVLKNIYVSDEDIDALKEVGEKESQTIKYVRQTDYKKISDALFIISTPNSTHYEILSSLKKKTVVLKEKPIAIDEGGFRDLKELERARKLVIYNAQQRYFNKSYIEARRLLPTLGQLHFIEYRYTLNDTEESWYWSKALGGGCLLNVGWHFFFLLNWFLRDEYIQKDIKVQSHNLSNKSRSSDITDTLHRNGDSTSC